MSPNPKNSMDFGCKLFAEKTHPFKKLSLERKSGDTKNTIKNKKGIKHICKTPLWVGWFRKTETWLHILKVVVYSNHFHPLKSTWLWSSRQIRNKSVGAEAHRAPVDPVDPPGCS